MRCKRCSLPAVIEIRRHNAAFCRDCFIHVTRQQVQRAIDHYHMLEPGERVLVAVSGGKDSLALWEILLSLGYRAEGLYLGLGIGGYSTRSRDVCEAFATTYGAPLLVHDLAAEEGFTIPQAARLRGRSSCSACGLSKRHLFNRVALQAGFAVMATGHNLDDEAAVLLGNTLRWDVSALSRQHPALGAVRKGLVRKIKPLYRVAERETAAYCIVQDIDYVIEECPLVAGNTQLKHKDTLNEMEENAPGTKHTFLFGFLEHAASLLHDADDVALTECVHCGMTTPLPAEQDADAVCAFCRMRSRLRPESDAPADPAVPVVNLLS